MESDPEEVDSADVVAVKVGAAVRVAAVVRAVVLQEAGAEPIRRLDHVSAHSAAGLCLT